MRIKIIPPRDKYHLPSESLVSHINGENIIASHINSCRPYHVSNGIKKDCQRDRSVLLRNTINFAASISASLSQNSTFHFPKSRAREPKEQSVLPRNVGNLLQNSTIILVEKFSPCARIHETMDLSSKPRTRRKLQVTIRHATVEGLNATMTN